MGSKTRLERIKEFLAVKAQTALGITPLLDLVREGLKRQTLDPPNDLAVMDFRFRHLYANPRYQEPGRLNLSEASVFSQNGEDGILSEIFRRIGFTTKEFVEFGVWRTGNNTINLLLSGWRGVWFEGNAASIEAIEAEYHPLLESGQLRLHRAFITAENIVELFRAAKVGELDLLSIDIDGNDYWVWKAIGEHYRPRVVVIEYNAKFLAGDEWVMQYNPGHVWDSTSYAGASLKALERLGGDLGYCLVGCDFTGNNAFFVRKELVRDDLFCVPYTSENHYENPKHFLVREVGHPAKFGPFVRPHADKE